MDKSMKVQMTKSPCYPRKRNSNVRNHEAWKQIFIRDQWAYDDLRCEFKHDSYRAWDNDTAQVACIGA